MMKKPVMKKTACMLHSTFCMDHATGLQGDAFWNLVMKFIIFNKFAEYKLI